MAREGVESPRFRDLPPSAAGGISRRAAGNGVDCHHEGGFAALSGPPAVRGGGDQPARGEVGGRMGGRKAPEGVDCPARGSIGREGVEWGSIGVWRGSIGGSPGR